MKTRALIIAQCTFCLISSLAFSSSEELQKLPPLETPEAREHEAFLRFRNLMPSQGIKKYYDELHAQWSYEVQVKAPYASLYLPLSRQVRSKANTLCQSVSGLQVDKPERYAKGEIPCGMVSDEQREKSLYIVTLPSFKFTEGDWNYEVSEGSIGVSLNPSNFTDSYRQPDLDAKQIPDRKNSEIFGDDVSVRFTGEALEVCAIVPGVSLLATTSARTVKATHTKSRLSESSVLEVSNGGGSFSQARLCKILNLKSGKGTAQSAPTLRILNSKKSPMYYASSLPIAERIRQYDMTLLANDLKLHSFIPQKVEASYISEGKWIADLIGRSFTTAAVHRFESMTESILNRLALPQNKKAFQQNIEDRCHMLSLSRDFEYGALWTGPMESFCKGSLERVEFEFLPPAKDSTQEMKGCYYGFARVHEMISRDRTAKWWTNECEVQGTYKVSLPVDMETYQSEFETLLNMTSNFNGVPKSWQPHLEELDIDAYQFWRMLFILNEKEQSRIEELDWKDLIPELAKDFK
jgi:hypothetical protein